MGRAALALCLWIALPVHAQMYKCVDERGVTHYADEPRPGCKGAPVNLQPIPPVSGQAAPARPADLSQQDAAFRRRQMEREQAEAKERRALEARCERLRREHAVLASGVRVASITKEGERVYLDDATREARLARLKDELRACP